MATKKDVKTTKKPERKSAKGTAVEKSGTRPIIDLTERLGFGEMANLWPSWLGRFPDTLVPGLSGIRIEEFRDGDDLVIRGEMPGLDTDDIEVTVDHGRLSIRAERERRSESENGLRSEFHYGSFARVLTLPEGADVDEVKASYEDGILEVRVPVHEANVKGRKVQVSRS